jgi:putative sterol carrier protein
VFDLEEVLKEWLEKVKKKVEEDENIQKDLKDFDGIFQLNITDGESYHVAIKKGEIGELEKGKSEDPRLSVTSDAETLNALMSGEMSAMKAFALRKIRLKGSFEDIIRLRKFLKTE